MEGSESDGCEEAVNNIDEDYEVFMEKKNRNAFVREELENKNRNMLDKYSAYDPMGQGNAPPMGTPGSNKYLEAGSSSKRDSLRKNEREDIGSPTGVSWPSQSQPSEFENEPKVAWPSANQP
jgi:hypothetical protein